MPQHNFIAQVVELPGGGAWLIFEDKD